MVPDLDAITIIDFDKSPGVAFITCFGSVESRMVIFFE